MKNLTLIFILHTTILFGQEVVHRFQPIQVTASRLMTSLAGETREMNILTQDEIESFPVQSVPELMSYISGVDFQQRGNGSVQADYSLRGSGFEQVLVLLNGIRINDPQTGHHNADIPVCLSDVDRIEILYGHASSMYGPDGYGGVINIITKKAESNQTVLSIGGGSFGILQTRLVQSLIAGNMSSQWSLERQQSEGYRPVTDYRITSVSNTSHWEKEKQSLRFIGGVISKDFGANGFYAPYPSREKTKAWLGTLNYIYQPHRWFNWTCRIQAKRHKDFFILDDAHPEYYQNDHTTDTWGTESVLQFHITRDFRMALGSEFLEESIQSSSLGNHVQERVGVFGEVVTPFFHRGILNSGIRLDHHKQWGFQLSPSLNVGYGLFKNIKWRAAAGRVFRAPTFTDFYYQSPGNIGNPDLKPETGWNIEAGFNGSFSGYVFGLTFFQRDERNRIDWIKYNTADPWRAVNLGHLKTQGVSVSISQKQIRSFSWDIHYTWLDQTQPDQEYFSKYQFRWMRHQVQAHITIHLPGQVIQSWNASFHQRQSDNGYWLLSTKWSRGFSHMKCYVEGRNLLGTTYQEIIDVPMPGRFFMGGIEVNFRY